MTAKEFLINYVLTHPENINPKTGEPYYKNITEFFSEVGYEYIYSEDCGDSRWWKNLFCVQQIQDKFIGYEWAETTGDDTAKDKGWEFDEDSVCFVEPYTETITTTKYKKIW